MFSSRGVSALALAVALAGCQLRTEVVVGVVSDLMQPKEIDTVSLQVQDAFDDVVNTRQWELGADGGYTVPGSFGLLPQDDKNASFTITLQGGHSTTDINGNTVFTPNVERKITTNFILGRTTFLRIGLMRSCYMKPMGFCGAGQTCVDGSCRSVMMDSTVLPDYVNRAEFIAECGDAAALGLDPPSGANGCNAPYECIDDSCQKLGGVASDLAYVDTAIPDLAMPDQSMPDLAMPDQLMPDLLHNDLSNPDLFKGDLSSKMPDLATPDLSTLGDLSIDQSMTDLFTPADQAGTDDAAPDLVSSSTD